MMLKRSTTESKPGAAARFVRVGLASMAALGSMAALATGCLDRPVTKAHPTTSNVFVDQIVQTAVDKIDLLFMVDNSVSMADKQEILKAAVPVLVSRLISPICVDGMGRPSGGSSPCTNGSPEFSPIGDIHIGIVSSSLGGHGSMLTGCGEAPQENDHARLIGSGLRTTFASTATWNNSGFLAWDSGGKANVPPGERVAANLQTSFQNMIGAVSEHGCGFEASLESWYRFLIDPEPPAGVVLDPASGLTARGTLDATNKLVPTALVLKDGKPVLDANGRLTCTNCDETLLAQRRAFLRPDSLVAIVMLSDENDCSIRDDSVGWFVGSSSRMPLSTKVCETDPNNKCCRSCAQKEGGPPDGCVALTADETCKNKTATQQFAAWDATHDALNLRCYNQHQRFGFDLLYETQRYVSALTNKTIALQSNSRVVVTNTLYDNTGSDKAPRDTSLVFLAGIVGVPWQDIADAPSLTGAGLNYLTAKELATPDAAGKTRWDYLLGTPGVTPPLDPFMIETTEPRSGINTLAQPPVAIVPATSTMPHANAINGHEQNIPQFDDLQYACIFPLQTPKLCAKGDPACDCSPDKTAAGMPETSNAVIAANSPLCQGGANINTQTSAKAYPGARELTVLRDLKDNAIVASICPKVTVAKGPPEGDPNYGYNPAVGAIIERLKEALKGKCLPRPIDTDKDPDSPTVGQVLCKVIEAQKDGCDCVNTPGRKEADAQILGPVQAQLKASGYCDGPSQTGNACKTWCQCEIVQATGAADVAACQQGTSAKPGYCYIDATSNSPLLAKCPSNQQQLLNFVGDSSNPTPAPGAVAFIACLGSAVAQVAAK